VAESSWPGEQLIVTAQDGDIDAITALVSGSRPNVVRFAHSLCATPEDAEDAAQEALIILYRKIGMLRASGALASWMFRIVRNECLRRARTMLRDHTPLRDAAARSAGSVRSTEAARSAETARSAEEEVLQHLEADRVAAAVAALPADQRHVLIMRDIQGYSGRMVADALGLSTAAMKSRLHRARAAVRHKLCDTPDSASGGNTDGNQD
jgi:RNA polymerase sigma factor (sigma-70 family)